MEIGGRSGVTRVVFDPGYLRKEGTRVGPTTTTSERLRRNDRPTRTLCPRCVTPVTVGGCVLCRRPCGVDGGPSVRLTLFCGTSFRRGGRGVGLSTPLCGSCLLSFPSFYPRFPVFPPRVSLLNSLGPFPFLLSSVRPTVRMVLSVTCFLGFV